ncbi:hypothetical protein FKP32DRAFT_1674320 [Trametes sanguinea]|nr:hypothetical protein FKP32DRAFT_1674320 [Trametes sanguinea]
MNLAVGGDWDGQEINAKKACQHLTLVGRGCSDAFLPQMESLRNVQQVVTASLGGCDEKGPVKDHSIMLRRRVFTKIRTNVNDDAPSALRTGDDPKNVFHALENRWRVTSKIQALSQNGQGEITRIPTISLRKGDFVDVAVRVMVAIMRRPGLGRRFQVFFEPVTVVRIASPMEVARAFRVTTEGGNETSNKKSGRKTMGVGFEIRPENGGDKMED